LEKGVETTLTIKIILALFILFISIIRPVWAFLFFPLILLSFSPTSKLHLALALLGGAVANIIIIFVFRYLGSPYPHNYVTFLLSNINSSFYNAIKLFLRHLQGNIGWFFSLNKGHLMEIIFKLSLTIVIVTFAITGIRLFRQAKSKVEGFFLEVQSREVIFHLLNLGLPWVSIILFHNVSTWRSYRMLVPHLLLSMLVLIASKKRLWLISLIVGIHLTGATSFIPLYKAYHTPRFIHDEQNNVAFLKSIKGVLKYEKGKPPWCNTLLTNAIAPLLLSISLQV
jgi:hypothetical protein